MNDSKLFTYVNGFMSCNGRGFLQWGMERGQFFTDEFLLITRLKKLYLIKMDKILKYIHLSMSRIRKYIPKEMSCIT